MYLFLFVLLNLDLQIRITTDSLVQSDGKKRILFADDLSSVKIFDETTPIRVSYDVILRVSTLLYVNSLNVYKKNILWQKQLFFFQIILTKFNSN